MGQAWGEQSRGQRFANQSSFRVRGRVSNRQIKFNIGIYSKNVRHGLFQLGIESLYFRRLSETIIAFQHCPGISCPRNPLLHTEAIPAPYV